VLLDNRLNRNKLLLSGVFLALPFLVHSNSLHPKGSGDILVVIHHHFIAVVHDVIERYSTAFILT
jgi:hypothetical protein